MALTSLSTTLDARLPTVAVHPDSIGLTITDTSILLTDGVTSHILTHYNTVSSVYFAAYQHQCISL